MLDYSGEFIRMVKSVIPEVGYSRDRIGIILINHLLEWASCAQLNCYDEKYTPAFLRLTYGEVTTETDLFNYISEIELEVTGHTGVLDVTAQEIMSGLDSRQVREFFAEFATVRHEKTDEFFPLMAELITVDAAQEDASDYTGIYYLNLLERELVGITPEMSFYDGCSGSGIGAAVISKDCKDVCLQDINRRCVFYSTIACIFRGIPAHHISIGDCLINVVQPGMQFDRIVMEPPTRDKHPKDYFAYIPDGNVMFPELEDSDSLYLRHALARLNDDGVAVVLVPAGFLYKSSKNAERARIKLIPYIDSVVYLPSEVGYRDSAISSAWIILKKNKHNHKIFMIDTSEYAEKEPGFRRTLSGGLDEVKKIYHDRTEVDNVSVFVSEQQIADSEYNLTPSKYVKKVETQEFDADELQRDLAQGADLIKRLNEIEQKLAALRLSMNK